MQSTVERCVSLKPIDGHVPLHARAAVGRFAGGILLRDDIDISVGVLGVRLGEEQLLKVGRGLRAAVGRLVRAEEFGDGLAQRRLQFAALGQVQPALIGAGADGDVDVHLPVAGVRDARLEIVDGPVERVDDGVVRGVVLVRLADLGAVDLQRGAAGGDGVILLALDLAVVLEDGRRRLRVAVAAGERFALAVRRSGGRRRRAAGLFPAAAGRGLRARAAGLFPAAAGRGLRARAAGLFPAAAGRGLRARAAGLLPAAAGRGLRARAAGLFPAAAGRGLRARAAGLLPAAAGRELRARAAGLFPAAAGRELRARTTGQFLAVAGRELRARAAGLFPAAAGRELSARAAGLFPAAAGRELSARTAGLFPAAAGRELRASTSAKTDSARMARIPPLKFSKAYFMRFISLPPSLLSVM